MTYEWLTTEEVVFWATYHFLAGIVLGWIAHMVYAEVTAPLPSEKP